ncbi:MAG: PIG-L family deacetylase [Nitrosomonas sp.]|nr:PIG-L family deacetylase [Nitrosomonas sp.]MBP6076068.1 PIG-L family deacetylase [Nitrosomonas sp.]
MENTLVPYQAIANIPSTSVLVFAPHPDDEVFGCGGAIMRHVEQGVPVRVIVISDGAHGVSEENIAEYTLQRQNESIAAAHILGYGTPIFWQYQDRQVCYSEKLIQEILIAIREAGADLIYAPSVFEMHPDHRVLGMVVIEAIRRIGKSVRVALYEVGMPLRPNQLLDISDLATRKMAAMECFVSQNAKQRYDLHITALNCYRTYTLPASVTAAEAYILVSAEELINDPIKLYQSEHTRQKALGLVMDSSDLPLVSVIIRSMDRSTLSDTLDSIALQTYPNIEVVVVNAKGADHRKMGEWCGHFPLHMISNDEPLQRSKAANRGLEAAKGSYLIFLDDDDWFLPHHVTQLAIELDRSESAIAAYSAIQCINQSGDEIRRFEEDFDPIQLRIDNFIPIHAVLFRRCVINKGVRFDEALDICEDWDFWLQVLEHGEFRFVAKVGAIYRMQAEMRSGVWYDAERTRQVMTTIYRKWFPRYEDKTLWSIYEYARYKRLFIELNHSMAERNTRIAEIEHSMVELEHSMAERNARIAELEHAMVERNTRIAEFEHAMIERNTRIAEFEHAMIERNTHIAELDQQIIELDRQVTEFLSSTSWQITKPLRIIKTFFQKYLTAPDDHKD